MTARKLGAARGLERTLKAISGRLDDSHAALVALARGLAAAVDAEPGNAALWREYRAAVAALGQVASGEVDDDTAAFLAVIRTPGTRSSVGARVTPTDDTGQSLSTDREGRHRPMTTDSEAVASQLVTGQDS